MLLSSGNVRPNPEPKEMTGFKTSADFKSQTGPDFICLNVRCLIRKMNLRIWAESIDADVIVM